MKSENYSTIEIVEAGLLASMAAIVYFIVGLFASLPIIFVVLKHSFRSGVLCSIVATILVYLFSGYFQATIFLAIFVSNGLFMSYFIKVKMKPFSNIILTTAFSFCFAVAALFIIVNVFNFNVIEIFNNQIETSKTTTLNVIDRLNMNTQDIDIAQLVERQINLLRKIFPALIYSVIFINTFITYFLLQYVCKRFNIKLPHLEKFLNFKIEDKFIWGIIVCLLVILFLNNYTYLHLFAVNLGIILFVFYFIQGIAILKFWFWKYNVHPLLQFLAMLLIIFGGLLILIGFIGIIDTWFDFRKIPSVKNDE